MNKIIASSLKDALELAEKAPRNRAKKPLKVFLASPSDVNQYRSATIDIFENINRNFTARKLAPKFDLYAWEISKAPGYTTNYQDDIFKEFGPWCDIFILLLWHRLGDGGTEAEYQKFKDKFSKVNPNVNFFVAHIKQKVNVDDINTTQLNRLRKFIKDNQSSWAPLGGVRGAITTVKKYRTLLHGELYFVVGE